MSEFSPEETRRLRRLLDEDDIRRLAMFYSHFQDHGWVDRLREVFTDDIECEFGPYGHWKGIDEVIKNFHGVKKNLGDAPFCAMHANTFHWIEFIDSSEAVGRRQLLDFLLTRQPDEQPLLWLGIYEDRYRKEHGRWRISHMRLEFLWPERHTSEGFPKPFPPSS